MNAPPSTDLAPANSTPWSGRHACGAAALVLAACAALALATIGRLSRMWSADQDMTYGWAVPLLALYIAWERCGDCPAPTPGMTRFAGWFFSMIAVGAAWIGMRVALEVFPEWPLMLWLFLFASGGLALGLLAASGGRRVAQHFAVPVIFLFTALPWPGWADAHVVAPLRLLIAQIAAQAVNLAGYPALVHGTVIELGKGMVGIEEACSGLRSLKAAIMGAVFLGELFRFSWKRRAGLLACAVGLALATNIARTSFLAWRAATSGMDAVEGAHDDAAWWQMLVALGGLALITLAWSRHARAGVRQPLRLPALIRLPPRQIIGLATVLLVLVGTGELGTRWWASHAAQDDGRLAAPTQWTARLPTDLATYQNGIFTPDMQTLLRCDSAELGRWKNNHLQRRDAYVLEWADGQIARQSIIAHNPHICLPAAGLAFVAEEGRVQAPVAAGNSVAFTITRFSDQNGPVFVFYAAWDLVRDRPITAGYELGFSERLQAIREGMRPFRARIIAAGIYGAHDKETAVAMFLGEVWPQLHR